MPVEQSNYLGLGHLRYPLIVGARVFSYRNLNYTPGSVCYSLRAAEGICAPGFDAIPVGRVFHHTPGVILDDCVFRVSAGGQKTVRAQRRKHVHAGVVGRLFAWEDISWPTIDDIMQPQWSILYYDPYRCDGFVSLDKAAALNGSVEPTTKIMRCDRVYLGSWDDMPGYTESRSLMLGLLF